MILALKNLGDSIHTSVVGAILHHTNIIFDNNSSSLKTGFSAAEDMLHKIVTVYCLVKRRDVSLAGAQGGLYVAHSELGVSVKPIPTRGGGHIMPTKLLLDPPDWKT